MKKIFAKIPLLFVFSILLSLLSPAVSAAGRDEIYAAYSLYTLGVLHGTGVNDDSTPVFELDRVMTRAEAVTLLVRLLGYEDEALSQEWDVPFDDAASWALPYIGCAYSHGLTAGRDGHTFDGASSVTSGQFTVFLLRALGYVSGVDFTVEGLKTFASLVGVSYTGKIDAPVTRGAAAKALLSALNAKTSDLAGSLAGKLVSDGVISAEAASAAGISAEMPGLTASQIFEKCAQSVFIIRTYDSKDVNIGSGSGFFINASGLAVTNYHLLELAKSARATLFDGKECEITGVYNYSIENDWAVIQVKTSGNSFLEQYTGEISSGDYVCTIGNPLGLSFSVSDGVIAAPTRIVDGVEYIQISAPISSGSSGGALLDSKGRVIGITSAGMEDGQNINLAVPLSIVDTGTSVRKTPVKDVTPVPTLKLLVDGKETDRVNVKVGETVEIEIRENIISSVTLMKDVDDITVASAYWGSWTSYYSISMFVVGNGVGETEVTISMLSNTDESLAEMKFKITVTQ